MKMYVYEWYSDKKGLGEEFVFDTEQEALNSCCSDWLHMTSREQALYFKNDEYAIHRVYEIEITQDELNAYNNGEDDVYLCEFETGYVPKDNVYWIRDMN